MWPFKKSKPANVNHDFTQEDRDLGGFSLSERQRVIRAKADQEIKLNEKIIEAKIQEQEAKIQQAKADNALAAAERLAALGPETDTLDNIFELIKFFKNPNQTGPKDAPPETSAMGPGLRFSNEQLNLYWNERVPAMWKKLAKKATDQEIQKVIRQQIPNIDDDSVQRAIQIVRESK